MGPISCAASLMNLNIINMNYNPTVIAVTADRKELIIRREKKMRERDKWEWRCIKLFGASCKVFC